MMKHSSLRIKVVLLAAFSTLGLLASGCGFGSAAVAAAASGGGGGGGPTTTITFPSTPGSQPDDDKTLLRFYVGTTGRMRLDYTIEGSTAQPIPIGDLELLRNNQPSTLPSPQGNTFELPASSELIVLRWNHKRTTGLQEARDSVIRISFEDFSPVPIPTTGSLTSGTIGRQAGTIEGLSLSQADGESPIVLRGTYSDFGDDQSLTTWQARISLERDTNGAPVWSPLNKQPTLTSRAIAPDGRVTYQLEVSISPSEPVLAPYRRVLPDFQMDISLSEAFGPLSRFPSSAPTLRTTPPVAVALPVQLGRLPSFVSEPWIPPNLGSERPWLQLPILVNVRNEFSSEPADLQLTAEYKLSHAGATWQPATLARTNEPQTTDLISLAPAETRRHFLIWNVIADLGLGLTLGTTVTVRVSAAVASSTPNPPGLPLRATSRESNTSALSTSPFVSFRDVLQPSAYRMASAGQLEGNTRHIFYTERDAVNNVIHDKILAVDQQFEPIAVPGFNAPDFGDPSVSNTSCFSSEVSEIQPTNYADGPNCIVRQGSCLFYAEWPVQGTPPAGGHASIQAIPSNPPSTMRRDPFRPINFEIGGNPASFRFLRAPRNTSANGNDSQVYLEVLVRDRNTGVFTSTSMVVTHVVAPEFIGTTRDPKVNAVGGEFDGDPNTYEVVLGAENAWSIAAADEGWMHMFTIHPAAGNTVTITKSRLPLPPAPACHEPPFSRHIQHLWWFLRPFQHQASSGGAIQHGLMLIRTENGDYTPPPCTYVGPNTRNMEHKVFTLLPDATGSLLGGTWTDVAGLDERDPGGLGVNVLSGHNLVEALVNDIDGRVGGNFTSDPLLVFTKQGPNGPDKANELSVWMLTTPGNGSHAWRELLRRAAPTITDGEYRHLDYDLVDLNGDDFLDLAIRESDKDNLGATEASSHWVYFSSSLSGVAGGIDPVQQSAGGQQARLPGLSDINGDGFTDLVVGGAVHFGQPDGTFIQRFSGFLGSSSSLFRAEQIMMPSVSRNETDVLSFDPSDFARNGVDVVGTDQTGNLNVLRTYRLLLSASESPLNVRPFVPQVNVANLPAKPLACIVPDGAGYSLRKATFNGTNFLLDPTPLATNVTPSFAAVRRGQVAIDGNIQNNLLPQDLVLIPATAPSRRSIEVLRFDAGYTAQSLTVGGASESILEVVAASISDDGFEDLLVLTVDTSGPQPIYRVWALLQDQNTGISAPSETKMILQFSSQTAGIRGFEFDNSSRKDAQGILITNEEIRFLLPFTKAGTFGARMIRSPIHGTVSDSLNLILRDNNGDGQPEVFGGGTSSGQLGKVNRNFRQ